MKGFKTITVNAAITVLPLVSLVADNGAMISALLGPYGAGVISVIGLVNIVLRWVTTTPVLKGD